MVSTHSIPLLVWQSTLTCVPARVEGPTPAEEAQQRTPPLLPPLRWQMRLVLACWKALMTVSLGPRSGHHPVISPMLEKTATTAWPGQARAEEEGAAAVPWEFLLGARPASSARSDSATRRRGATAKKGRRHGHTGNTGFSESAFIGGA